MRPRVDIMDVGGKALYLKDSHLHYGDERLTYVSTKWVAKILRERTAITLRNEIPVAGPDGAYKFSHNPSEEIIRIGCLGLMRAQYRKFKQAMLDYFKEPEMREEAQAAPEDVVVFFKEPGRYWTHANSGGEWIEWAVPPPWVVRALHGKRTGLYRVERPKVPAGTATLITPGDLM